MCVCVCVSSCVHTAIVIIRLNDYMRRHCTGTILAVPLLANARKSSDAAATSLIGNAISNLPNSQASPARPLYAPRDQMDPSVASNAVSEYGFRGKYKNLVVIPYDKSFNKYSFLFSTQCHWSSSPRSICRFNAIKYFEVLLNVRSNVFVDNKSQLSGVL